MWGELLVQYFGFREKVARNTNHRGYARAHPECDCIGWVREGAYTRYLHPVLRVLSEAGAPVPAKEGRLLPGGFPLSPDRTDGRSRLRRACRRRLRCGC